MNYLFQVLKNSKVDLMLVVEVQEEAQEEALENLQEEAQENHLEKVQENLQDALPEKFQEENHQKDFEIILKKMISTEMHLNMSQLPVNQLAIFIMIHLSIM